MIIIKLTKQQLKQLRSCFHIGYDQTLEVDSNDLRNDFVKEKDIKRKHKIMDNVLRKIFISRRIDTRKKINA